MSRRWSVVFAGEVWEGWHIQFKEHIRNSTVVCIWTEDMNCTIGWGQASFDRTCVNVYGDACVAAVVDKKMEGRNPKQELFTPV